MERLKYYGYSGMHIDTKFHLFLQGIRCSELEAAVNVVLAQTEKYGTDFDATMSYVGQKVMKKGSIMQSIHIAQTRSQPVMPKVAALMGKVDCKKCPKAIWNSVMKEQQMQMKMQKLHEQQGIKSAARWANTEARIVALEAQLGLSSQPK